jgi:molybdenum cofactor biosynthesis enzyme MoaA
MDRLAEPLRRAGLRRANISLDSLRRDRFKQITRRDALDRVLAGIDATLAAGLHPVKINAVVVRGLQRRRAEPMAAWARDLGVELRFIEFMPLDAPGRLDPRPGRPGRRDPGPARTPPSGWRPPTPRAAPRPSATATATAAAPSG